MTTNLSTTREEKMRKNARIFAIIAAVILTPYALADESIKNEAVIKKCDLNGDGQIYGRKDAKAHKIPMDIAKAEHECKMKIVPSKMDKRLAELTRRSEEATRRNEEATRRNEEVRKKLYDEIVKIANSGEKKED